MDYRCCMALSESDRNEILELADAINARNRRARADLERELRERIAAAHREIDRLVASFLSIDPALRRVVLFGSLAREGAKRLDFDIDLAVDTDRYMELLDPALDSEFTVDLVDIRTASPYIMQSVERDGIEVFSAG